MTIVFPKKKIFQVAKENNGFNRQKKDAEFAKLKSEISLIRDTVCCQDIRVSESFIFYAYDFITFKELNAGKEH